MSDAHFFGHEDCVALLEAAGAKMGSRPNAKSITGPQLHVSTDAGPLIAAAANGDLGRLVQLVAGGKHASVADYDLRTPLHLAASNGHTSVVEYVIAQEGTRGGTEWQTLINAQDRWGATPLDDARREGHTACAELLEALLHETI